VEEIADRPAAQGRNFSRARNVIAADYFHPPERRDIGSTAMAQVISKCPLTGHYKFMGIDMTADRFAALPDSFARQFCPFCACEHAWLKKDSKLVDRRPVMRRGVQQAS
jgi:hypothetical protein